ncbi:MAG: enoyl-CoA hydratase, partial [Saprospiraceae bacterium]|nr:enoyl-CoA hydratase [Saprospiraceae bacterium]
MEYKYFLVDIKDQVATVSINRPEKANSFHMPAWKEMKKIFEDLDQDENARVVILKGEGKNFSAGMDLQTLMNLGEFQNISGEARKREALRGFIVTLQECINAIEECRKPVIAAVHGACVGGAINIATACDMRFSCSDSFFTIKEIDLGLVADMGVLQRL